MKTERADRPTQKSYEDLVDAHRAGDRTALPEILRRCEGLIAQSARRVGRNRVSIHDDLLQEGRMGVVSAVEKYDRGRAQFVTYATKWIRARQLRYVMDNVRDFAALSTRELRHVFQKGPAARARREALGLPTDAESLAEDLDVSADIVRDFDARMQPQCDHDALVEAEDNDYARPHDNRDAVHDGGRDYGGGSEDKLAILARFRETLDHVEKYLFDHRLNPETLSLHTTLQQVGRRLGVSKERARQIEADLVDQIRGMQKVS